MSKKLRVRDYFLLGLALMGDVVDEVVGGGSWMYHHRQIGLWAPPAYKRQNFYETLYRMLQTEYLEKIIKNGKPYFRLTGKGKKKLVRDFRIDRWQRKKWDGFWRLVVFDISEKAKYTRDALRDKLKELGFGMLQKSIYLTPFNIERDIAEFLDNQKLLGRAFVLTARHRFMGDAKKLANYVWRLEELDEKYNKLLKKIKRIERIEDQKKREEKIRQLRLAYFQLLLEDPFLPFDLLPKSWLGEKVRQEIAKF